ncbi:MAG: PEGA domain protein [Pelotomaculum sp. PtaB.Bin104]|nr:MAG: PEGA domain protein [Pelotomaculum sp. PtaB.Bin104]
MKKLFTLLFLIVAFTFSGCVSKTVLNTYPQGARVSVDGEFIGVSPIQYEDKAVSGHTVNILLQKYGYKDKSSTIKKDDLYIHRFFAPPLFALPWIMGYKEQYTFELEKDATKAKEMEERNKNRLSLDPEQGDRIFLTNEQLPLVLKYDVLGSIQVGEDWYKSSDTALQAMANEARRMGANAVIEVKTWHQPSGRTWAAPFGSGIAVRVINPSLVDFTKLTGTWK